VADRADQTQATQAGPTVADAAAASAPRSDASGLDVKVTLTRAALAWEIIWPPVLGALCLFGLYAAVSLIDGWSFMPGFVHWAAALAVLGGSAWIGFRELRDFAWPTRADALRRIEQHSGLAHRPLSSLEDARTAFTGDREDGAVLWKEHLKRQQAAALAARTVPPRSRAPLKDAFALRAAVLLLLASALVFAGRDAPARLAQNALPGAFMGTGSATIAFDAWITPPAYTSIPPLFLNTVQDTPGDTANAVTMPEGSILTARVYGAASAEARLAGTGTDFEADVSGAHEIALTLEEEGPLQLIANGRVLDEFEITLTPDLDPQIMFTEGDALSVTAQLSLAVGYDLLDDYGITHAEMRVTLPNPDDVAAITDQDEAARESAQNDTDTADSDLGALATVTPPVLKLPLPSARVVDAEGEFAYKDLTSHPWAGLQVAITLAAFDEAGQEGTSNTRIMRLPQRRFTDPVARAVIEQRQRLARTPEEAPQVATAINALTLHADRYYETAADYLPLRAAFWRLRGASHPDDLEGIYDLLWDIALHFEDGDLSLAEAALRDAQDALMDALANGASDAEIERLMNELRQAMDEFLQALAQQQMQAAENGDMVPMDPNMQALEAGDLESLLDALQDLAQSGSREAARQLLSELRQMMENLATGMPGQMNMTPPQSAMNDAIGQMGEIIDQQRALQDETVQEGNAGQPGEQDGPSGGSDSAQLPGGSQTRPGDQQGAQNGAGGTLAQRQQGVRDELNRLREGLDGSGVDSPSALGRADRAMRDAEDALANGDLDRAARKQGEAIENLREGAQALAETLLEDLAMSGEQQGQDRGQGGEGRDPLGRPQRTAGPQRGDGVEVPDESEIQRARRILEELQRRAGDRNRPPIELDYLNRLLQRF